MTDLFINFQMALEKFGEPKLGEKLSKAELEGYRGRLPDSLLEFWSQYGLGFWLKGYFQFCNPSVYKPILKLVFGNDPEFKPEKSHVVGFSAFGRLLVWNEDYRVMDIDLIYHYVLCDERFEPRPKISNDIRIGNAILGVDDDASDPADQNGKPLYKRTLKANGELAYGQIYAPKLHPALGGSITVENFRSASALEAMSLAAQAGPFDLRDMSSPRIKVVRQLGGN